MCSSQDLSVKKLFPTFARTFPLADFVIPSIKKLLQTFNWTKVAVIYSNDSGKYLETSGELLHALKNYISYKVGMKSTTYNPKERRFESIMPQIKQNARSEHFCMLFLRYIQFYLWSWSNKSNISPRNFGNVRWIVRAVWPTPILKFSYKMLSNMCRITTYS